MQALGFIETLGLLPAIEAADAMLKAAEVHLLDKSLATGGLVTITVTGEVAAVKAAVDAGVASVGRIAGATLVSQHVIARPDTELKKIVSEFTTPKDSPAPKPATKAEPTPATTQAESAAATPPATTEAKAAPASKVKTAAPAKPATKKKSSKKK